MSTVFKRVASPRNPPPVCTSNTPPIIPPGLELTLTITLIDHILPPFTDFTLHGQLTFADPTYNATGTINLQWLYANVLAPNAVQNNTVATFECTTADLDQVIQANGTDPFAYNKSWLFDLRAAAKAGGAI